MTKKQYDLKTILSKDAYDAVQSYCTPAFANGNANTNYAVDALALIGKIAFDNAYPTQNADDVVAKFHNLADPTFINVFDDWGATYVAKNEMAGVNEYIDGKFNSFSLKTKASNLSYLPFPLRANRMSADKNFTNYSIPFGWEDVKTALEKNFSVKIAEGSSLQDAQTNMFEKLLSPAVRIKGTNKVLISQAFNGAKLSDAEKCMAIIDLISHENVKKLLSEDKALANDFKNVDATTARQILYASQITADMFASLATNLGAENHKQIDNALRLELCGVLANLKDKSAVSLKLYAKVAEKMTNQLLGQLHQNTSNIVENRKAMGITYIDNLYPNSQDFIAQQPNLKVVMFGRTINNAFKLENNQVMFVGNSPAFDVLAPNAKDAQKQTTSTKVEDLLSDQSMFFAQPQPQQEEEIIWIPEDQPDGTLPTEIDWIPEDNPETEIDEFDMLKIKALEDHFNLPLPAGDNKTAESTQEAILLPPVQDKPQVIALPPVQEPVKKAQPKMRSLASLVAQTQVARRDAEMFGKTTTKTTKQIKLFNDDYVATPTKAVEQKPQTVTLQTTLGDYEEKSYLDLRPLIENVPVINRSILHEDMKDFDLSKGPIFEAQTTEETNEETPSKTTTIQRKKTIKVERKNTVRNIIGYGKSPLEDVKKHIQENEYKKNAKDLKFVKTHAKFLAQEKSRQDRADALKYVSTHAEYLADQNQGIAGAKKLVFVADHKDYLDEEAKLARIERVRAKMREWQVNNAKQKIAQAVANATALKEKVENAQPKISKRKKTSGQRLKPKGPTLHVWKDGHYDFV